MTQRIANMYKKTTLSNGLRVLLFPFKEARSVNVTFYVRGGSRFETKQKNGVAHFLEHMAFKGTKDLPSQFELAKFVEGFGASWNAETDTEDIKYYISAESSHLNDILYVLGQLICHPLLKETDIENEKRVIIEEINMINDIPDNKAGLLVDELMWPNQPIGRSTAGTKETVSSFMREGFVSYVNSHFSADNCLIGVSGMFEEGDALKLIEKNFSMMKTGSMPEYEKAKIAQTKPNVLVERKEIDQAHFCLNFRGVGRNDPNKYAVLLSSMILGGGMASRLFQKIRTELGLCYYIGAGHNQYMDCGVFQISCGANTKKCDLAVEEILKEVANFCKSGANKEEITRNKEHIKGYLALKLEDHKKMNRFIGEQELLNEKVLSYEEFVSEINKVTNDDILEVARKIFVNQALNLAVVGNVSENRMKEVAKLNA